MENGTVIAGDIVLAAGMSRVVRALALADGSERWAFQATAFVFAPPAVIDGVAYVATYERLYALAGETFDVPVRSAITDYLTAHPRGRLGRIATSWDVFGIDEVGLRSRFGSYIDRFLN